MPASRSSNCEPNSATPISLRLRGSSSLFRASTVSKNAAFRSDVELLDGVGHFVDAEQAGVSAFHEGAHELVGAQAEGRKLRRVFVQGVEQVAVFVCAVLCAGGD